MPDESVNDLNRLRQLLEHVVEQAKEIISSNDRTSTDAIALVEDAAGLRSVMARDAGERVTWQREMADARQRLLASDTRIASVGGLPGGLGRATRSSTGNATAAPAHAAGDEPATEGTNVSNQTSARPPAAASAPAASRPTVLISRGTQPEAAPGGAKQDAKKSEEKTGGAKAEVKEGGAAGDQAPVKVGSLEDKATHRVQPSYPVAARAARISGMVTVYLTVDENGSVASVEGSIGPQLLQQPAMEAARRWKFKPTVIDGKPVRVTGHISFNFKQP